MKKSGSLIVYRLKLVTARGGSTFFIVLQPPMIAAGSACLTAYFNPIGSCPRTIR